jgi:hypothetical protein
MRSMNHMWASCEGTWKKIDGKKNEASPKISIGFNEDMKNIDDTK